MPAARPELRPGWAIYDLNCIYGDDSMPFDLVAGRQELLVDGERVPPASGRYFTTVNPATEQPVASVAEAGVEDVDRAVRSSRAALAGPWAQMRAVDRGRLLLKFAEVIRDAQDELVQLESLDSGKPVSAIRR